MLIYSKCTASKVTSLADANKQLCKVWTALHCPFVYANVRCYLWPIQNPVSFDWLSNRNIPQHACLSSSAVLVCIAARLCTITSRPSACCPWQMSSHCEQCMVQMESDLEAYRVWYPPVRSSLLCLSKLYGCVDPKIFNGLAQDAVHAATASVQVSAPPLQPGMCFYLFMIACHVLYIAACFNITIWFTHSPRMCPGRARHDWVCDQQLHQPCLSVPIVPVLCIHYFAAEKCTAELVTAHCLNDVLGRSLRHASLQCMTAYINSLHTTIASMQCWHQHSSNCRSIHSYVAGAGCK